MYIPIQLVSHMYWHEKNHFALAQDQYEHWTMFAPVKGKFRFEIGQHAGEGEFGQVVVCPPDTVFARSVIDPLSFHFFHFRLEPPAPLPNETERSFSGLHVIEDQTRLRSTYRFIGKPGLPSAELGHFMNDLWLLATAGTDEPHKGLSDTSDPLMKEAGSRLAKEAFGSVSLRAFASSLGLTPVQLTRRFRSAFGVTPIDFLTELRLEKACLLLAETNQTVEQIAVQCGYESGFYLSRLFRSRKGVSPSEYRRLSRV